jgi:hypothetical protein
MRPKSDLRGYQNRLATTLYESTGHMGVYPMGSGKTCSALTAIEEMIDDEVIRHALVIAPKRVAQLVWPDEIKLWEHTQDIKYALLNGDPRKREVALDLAGKRDMTIVGIDNTQWLVEQLEKFPDDHPIFDLLVIDEISKFRNPKGKRAKALLGQTDRFKNIWGLTGTPRPNGLEDLFKPLQIVTRGKLWGKAFYKWRKERFYPTDFEQRNWKILPDWEEQTSREAASIMSTLAPEDMPQLPPINVVEHFVELSHDAWEAYDTMEKELFAAVGPEGIFAASAGVASGKLSQAANGFMYGNDGVVTTLHTAKEEWIDDLVDSMAGSPLLIIYEFHQDLAVLKKLFGADLPYLGAGVKDDVAAKHVEDWNAKRLPILALHPASGGHGLNLQDGGHQMAMYGLPWSAELYEQVIKRIHRSGQTEPCFIHICMARETIDELKRYRVLLKMTNQEAFKKYIKKV